MCGREELLLTSLGNLKQQRISENHEHNQLNESLKLHAADTQAKLLSIEEELAETR